MSSLAAMRRFRLTTKQAPLLVGGLLGVGWVAVLLTHHDQLQPTVFGLDTGALIAAFALSVTLTYRGSQVVNFSVAAMALYGTFIFFDLFANGALFFPPPIPSWQVIGTHSINVSGIGPEVVPPMSVWVAFVVTLAICGLMGLAFHWLIFRPLRHAPPLAKVAASIGLFLFLFATVNVRFSQAAASGYIFPSTLLPQGQWHVDGIVIPENQAMLAILVVAVAAVLWAIFRFTRYGIAMRAAAENERGALILGYSPDRYAAVNWAASMVLAGAAGILVTSIQGSLSSLQIIGYLVFALAAALVGRFVSFPVTVIAGLLIGSSQAWIGAIQNDSWFPGILKSGGSPLPNIPTLIPFLAIVVVLFLRGERLPSRGSEAALRMPKAVVPKRPLLGMTIMFVAIVVAAFLFTPDWEAALPISIIAAVMCASLTVITGFVGQISLMQMTIAGVAAFVLSKFCDAHHIAFPFGPLIAALAATVIGLVAAIPALRVRGVNLAIVTLAAAYVIENFVYTLPAFVGGVGANGQTNVAAPSLFGWNLGPDSRFTKVLGLPPGSGTNPWFAVFCAVVLVLVLVGILWIRRANLGRRMLAVRSNERAAAASGVHIPMTKMTAFAIAAFIAGIGGALWGYNDSGVSVQDLSSLNSIILLAVAYLGGISMIEGAPISGLLFQGAIFATFLSAIVHINSEYAVYIAGIGLIFASINNPEGIAGTFRDTRARIARMRSKRRLIVTEGPPEPEPSPVLETTS